jgi:hypothetical protein
MVMPNSVKVFPRGYSGGQVGSLGTHSLRNGDDIITQLYQEFTSHDNKSLGWEFRRRVIAEVKRLLSGNVNWFIKQDSNAMVTKYSYEFLLDTLRFIATGRRRLSIFTWPDLVGSHPAGGLENVSERREIADMFEKLLLSTSADALIQRWCSQKGGFDDMMYSINLLFGDVHLRGEH